MKKLKFVVASMLVMNNYLFSNVIDKKVEQNNTIFSKNKMSEAIKNTLATKYTPLLIDKKVLTDYYAENSFKPYWVDKNGIKNIAIQLFEKIKTDPVLKPNVKELFKFDEVLTMLNSLNQTTETDETNLLKIEFMITELYDKYSYFLLNGTIDWKGFQDKLKEVNAAEDMNAQWDRYDVVNNPKKLLKKAIDANDLGLALKELDPVYNDIPTYVEAINELEKIKKSGDFVKVPAIKGLKVGDNNPEVVPLLRKRLMQSNDLSKNCDVKKNSSCEQIFDEDLSAAVASFQKTHGLFPDGVIGLATIRFLNLTAREKISQIRVNIERMRWLPRNFGSEYILINIPDYRLKMVENNEQKLNMPVVVGEKKHPTPIFSEKMSYIVLNPAWNIPTSITKKELLPKILKDKNYLASKGINTYQSSPNTGVNKMSPNEVLDALILEDQNTLNSLRFSQNPGDENPLGKIKFMLPNKHAVYLHDTPAKNLFNNVRRAYSHGCIRLSKPQELLETIAKNDKGIDLTKVTQILNEGSEKEKSVGLSRKIPVHIIYLTSWIDDGKVQYREDIYNYDSIQRKLMF